MEIKRGDSRTSLPNNRLERRTQFIGGGKKLTLTIITPGPYSERGTASLYLINIPEAARLPGATTELFTAAFSELTKMCQIPPFREIELGFSTANPSMMEFFSDPERKKRFQWELDDGIPSVLLVRKLFTST